MSRPNSVWWWAAQRRWAITVGGKRYAAPKAITQEDAEAAQDWAATLIECGKDGRVPRVFELKPISVRRLKQIVAARRREPGERIHAGHVLDELIEAAWRASKDAAAED